MKVSGPTIEDFDSSRKRKIRYSPLKRGILSKIFFQADLAMWAITRPANFRFEYIEGRMPTEEWEKINNDARQRRVLRKMKAEKWLSDRKIGDEVVIRLSKNAMLLALQSEIRNQTITLPNRQKCLIIFDFPNAANRARNSWRNLLYSTGFQKYQLSAFITERDVCEPVAALVRVLGLENWVKVLLVNGVFAGDIKEEGTQNEPITSI